MRTAVYIDGFNLYYGCLKGTSCKWLDVAALAARLLPGHQVCSVKYFTARVSATLNDPGQSARQDAYLRALADHGGVQIIHGRFQVQKKRYPAANGGGRVEVIVSSEKGSDVNLAAHLLADGFQNRYEQALVISNDSDLAEAVRLVRVEARKPVGVALPIANPGRPVSADLKRAAGGRVLHLSGHGPFKACQLPDPVMTASGPIHKPPGW